MPCHLPLEGQVKPCACCSPPWPVSWAPMAVSPDWTWCAALAPSPPFRWPCLTDHPLDSAYFTVNWGPQKLRKRMGFGLLFASVALAT